VLIQTLYKEDGMLAELSFIPVSGSPHLSGDIAKAVSLIDESGLPFQITPTGTCIEGEWDEVISVVGRARNALLERHGRMVTLLKLDDDPDDTNRLSRNVESVRSRLNEITKQKDENEIPQRPENLVVYDT